MSCQDQWTTGSTHRTDKCSFPKATELIRKANHKEGGASKYKQEVLDTAQNELIGQQVQVSLEPGSAKAGHRADPVCDSDIH